MEGLERVGRQLYEALLAILDEVGGPDDWDAEVEIMFNRGKLDQGLSALAAAEELFSRAEESNQYRASRS